MRKLVLGIIAVICLDIAFITYPGSNHPGEWASATINSGPRQVNSVPNLANANAASPQVEKAINGPETADTIAADAGPPFIPRSVSSEHRRPPIARTNYVKRSETVRIPKLDARFKPVVITIGNASSTAKYLNREADLRESPKKEAADDRSFISSVVPIVKKPYEWIKLLGSKLR